MSSHFGGRSSNCSSSSSSDRMTLDPTENNFALELKSAPKQICIPMQQRMSTSETNVHMQYDVPDKSWSVLYIGAAKEKAMK